MGLYYQHPIHLSFLNAHFTQFLLHDEGRPPTQRMRCVAEGIGEGFGQRFTTRFQRMQIAYLFHERATDFILFSPAKVGIIL